MSADIIILKRRKQRAATAEEWANTEFKPESVAFRRDYWENFVRGAFVPMHLATAMLKQTKNELVESTRKIGAEDPCALDKLVEDMLDVQQTLEKYASILNACRHRLVIVDAVLEVEAAKEKPPAKGSLLGPGASKLRWRRRASRRGLATARGEDGGEEAAFLGQWRALDAATQADMERVLRLPDADRSAVLRLYMRLLEKDIEST